MGDNSTGMDLGRLSAIVDALADAVTIRGPDNHLIYANQAALDRLGMDSVEDLRAADPRALMGGWEVTDEKGAPVAMDDLPSVRVLRGEEAEPLLLRAVAENGKEQWSLLKATALRGEDGEIEAAVTIIEDITALKRAARQMEFLVGAGKVLASSLDYQQTLRNVADLAVPHIADWCAVDLVGEDGKREQVAVAHVDPSKIELARRLRGYEPRQLDPEHGIGRVLGTGEALLYTHVSDELLAAAALDEEHLRLLREVGIGSALIVPMRAGRRTIGALMLVHAESGRAFDSSDVEFAEQIAERAALAVENARLYTERSEVAVTLQRTLLPDALPRIPGWKIAALYRPAGHGGDVGGDFYDFWQLDGDWLLMVGDVTGKGVGAAAVTSLVRHTAWAASEVDPHPAEILARVDATLRRRSPKAMCTALCLRLSGERASIAVGGHPPPLLIGGAGTRELGSHEPLLGAFAGAKRSEVEFALRPGETLLAFTDGVTDTIGPGGERFGMRRLRELAGRSNGLSPDDLCARLLSELERFQVGPQADDTAVVAMRYTAGE